MCKQAEEGKMDEYYTQFAAEQAEYAKAEAAKIEAHRQAHPHLADYHNRAGNPALTFYGQMHLNGD